MHRILRRGALLALTGAVSVLLSTLVVPPAQAADPTRAEQSASWLSGQLTAGLVHSDQFGGYDDYGLSIDVAFAFQEIGGRDATVAEIDTALQPNVGMYTGAAGEVYAGSVAKLLVLAQSVGTDPTTYGGVDLVNRLSRRVSTKPVIAGRIQDKSAYGDYANTIGQAFAARALKTAGADKAPSALAFLLRQQCAKGYFRLNFTKSTTSATQSCDQGNPRTTSAPDTDATAIAVLQLDAMTGKSRRTKEALAKAVAWLKIAQRDNGSFGGGTSTEGANTNSTGMAGWALGASGACGAAQDAAEWVARWQVDSEPAPLAGELGAIAYDKAAYLAAQTAGITPELEDQWRRATAQAAPGLTNLVLADCRTR